MVDMFEFYDELPLNVRDILNSYSDVVFDYVSSENLIFDLNKVGWTCEYGLDGVPYKLMKIDDKDNFTDCLESLRKVNNLINRNDVIMWYNENDIDYSTMNDFELYINYIEKNLS